MPLRIQEVREDLPEDMVPVDRRWLGLDRASVRPALLVLALAVLYTVVLPLAAAVVPDRDVAAPGTVLELAGGATVAPPAGWEITDGLRPQPGRGPTTYPATATVTDGPATIAVQAGAWRGDAATLLVQVRATPEAVGLGGARIVGDPQPFRTAGGTGGLLVPFDVGTRAGVVAVVVVDGIPGPVGVVLAAAAPTLDPQDRDGAIQDMIESIGSRR